MFRSRRIDSIPRWTIRRLSDQKSMKHTAWGALIPRTGSGPPEDRPGAKTPSIRKRASPPIQVWMPNQPQATKARRSAATLAPRVPNEARQSTGNGMP